MPTPPEPATSTRSDGKEFLARVLENFDLPKFFEALPTDEFSERIGELEDAIVSRQQQIAAAEKELKALQAQAETFKQALQIRDQVIDLRERERKREATKPDPAKAPMLSPKRKRAEVLRVFEDHPGMLLSPLDVRKYLARAGLIDPRNETGTPVRILLAQLREAGVLTRPESGKYRLKNRDERLATQQAMR